MGKRGLAKMFSGRSGSSDGESQGSMGSGFGFLSGIVGHFGIGTTVHCDSDDDSFYCTLTKVTSGLMQFITLFIIMVCVIYAIRYFTRMYGSGKKARKIN